MRKKPTPAEFEAFSKLQPALGWIADGTGFIYWYNLAWYHYTGTTPDQMEGWGWQSVHDPERLPEVLKSWKNSIATGEPFEMVFPLRGADGIFRPFLTRVVPYRHDGQITHWFGNNTEIAELMAMQERLQIEVEERRRAQRDSAQLAMLVSQSPDAIFSAELNGNIETWNAGATALFGYSASEVIGRPQNILVPEGEREDFEHVIAGVRAGEAVELETERLTKEGELIAVDLIAGPLRDPAGNVIGTGVAARDMRERKRHQQEMQVVLHELSHRAKNLLSIVSAMANQTARVCDNFGEFQQRFGDRLQALAASHDALVERNWTGVPMNELARVQLAPFQEISAGRISAIGPNVIVKAKAAEQIGLCLHELATNATKYGSLSAPLGTVEVNWKLEHSDFHLSWQERGGPAVVKPVRIGFGSLVLQRLAAHALNGKAIKEFSPEGITWKLSCPAPAVIEGAAA